MSLAQSETLVDRNLPNMIMKFYLSSNDSSDDILIFEHFMRNRSVNTECCSQSLAEAERPLGTSPEEEMGDKHRENGVCM